MIRHTVFQIDRICYTQLSTKHYFHLFFTVNKYTIQSDFDNDWQLAVL